MPLKVTAILRLFPLCEPRLMSECRCDLGKAFRRLCIKWGSDVGPTSRPHARRFELHGKRHLIEKL